jgi:hypothetical protein
LLRGAERLDSDQPDEESTVPQLKAKRSLDQTAQWTARHRFVGPLGLGFAFWGALLVVDTGAVVLALVVVGRDGLASDGTNMALAVALGLPSVALYVGTSVPGYIVGRAGVGRAGLLLSVGGLIAPFALEVVLLAFTSLGMKSSGIAMLLGLPVVVVVWLTPFAIGYRRGRRAERRAAETLLPARLPVTFGVPGDHAQGTPSRPYPNGLAWSGGGKDLGVCGESRPCEHSHPGQGNCQKRLARMGLLRLRGDDVCQE